ncbi:CaiB/BaiF CoA transferase family protein [Bradyrhizobium elkanii]|uniref:CaiB/BaiF CoA transferase family protein n=1 Tax=Bradyrhizobium elkanii TaxID=29448 RepID=UPI0008413202|nr:CaiB/BaiF CoA-transferase family protein [Bradyrhizobium elkanii]ODM76747.1 carnitine dehydratase [Bradyrhizobium elkanii]ODM80826.1 carnitine dehydratase [Bradyrhizobium elkanii]
MATAGPLAGIRIVEMAGLGPAPLAGQLLADLGADVISVDRAAGKADPTDINRRNKRSIALDLKQVEATEACKRLIARADVVIEGFRPGVMERLGLGPAEMCAANPRLVYARMTGWGQAGPWASTAGHDINYISLSGSLNSIGQRGAPPVPPLNFVGDYGGGTMFLIFGILAALVERQRSDRGQVVDAAMVDGVAAMMSVFYMFHARRDWSEQREANLLDGGAPFYRCYETADGKAMAVGPIEPQFYAEFCARLGLAEEPLKAQNDRSQWSEQTLRFARAFKEKSRDEWARIFEGSDACVSPVLTIAESERHPHLKDRGTVFRGESDVLQAAPAPRFARTPAPPVRPPLAAGASGDEILAELGYASGDIDGMRSRGALR